MNEFDKFVLREIPKRGPPRARAQYSRLYGSEDEQISAATLLQFAGYAGAAQVLRVLLPRVPPRVAKTFRITIDWLDRVPPDIPEVAPNGLNLHAARWCLRDKSTPVRSGAVKGVLFSCLTTTELAAHSGPNLSPDDWREIAELVGPRLPETLVDDLLSAASTYGVPEEVRTIIAQATNRAAQIVEEDLRSHRPWRRILGVRMLPRPDLPAEAFQSRLVEIARNDSDPLVRQEALLRLSEHAPQACQLIIEEALRSPHAVDRAAAVRQLPRGALPTEAFENRLLQIAHTDPHPDVMRAARLRLLKEAPPVGQALIEEDLRSSHVRARLLGVQLLTDTPPGALESGLLRIARTDPDSAVRDTARARLFKEVPQACHTVLPELLRMDSAVLLNDVLKWLEETLPPEEAATVLLNALRDAGPERSARLLGSIERVAPVRFGAALARCASSKSVPVRRRLLDILKKRVAKEAYLPAWGALAHDANPHIRREARICLREVVWQKRPSRWPAELHSIWIADLRSKAAERRAFAVRALRDDPDPLLLDELLPLARDAVERVRREALPALCKFDDPRVLAELVSSLGDVEESVRSRARGLLIEGTPRVTSLRHFARPPGAEPIWERMRREVRAAERWAHEVGLELLGRPVTMHPYRQGLGRTHGRGSQGPIEIEITDTPITRNHRHGADIVRGLILHELGHHAFDIGVRGSATQRGIARSEGVGHIYDLLLDERLERALRARQPEWGRFFDRLMSYAFAQNAYRVPVARLAKLLKQPDEEVVRAIRNGTLPGKLTGPTARHAGPHVLLRDRDMLLIPGLVPHFVVFMACLRCGFDPNRCPDPRIAKAVACVPSDLKNLSHAEVLQAARRVARFIGSDDTYRRQLAQSRQRWRENRRVLGALRRALERLAETGQLPGLGVPGAPGIRKGGLAPEEAVGDPNETAQVPGAQGIQKGDRAPDQAVVRGAAAARAIRALGRLSARSRLRTYPHGAGGQAFDPGRGSGFPPLTRTRRLSFDAKAHACVLAKIRPHVRRLRTYLERLGRRAVERFAERRGRRLDLAAARRSIYSPRLDLFVRVDEVNAASLYLGLLIDRSGSMAGEKLQRAIAFGVLLAEAAKGLPGIDGHVNAFDGMAFYNLGTFRRNAIASLTADDSNNDAGALGRAVELALKSRRRRRLIVMVSDGLPAACTFMSLEFLVKHVTEKLGIVCAQVAVAPVPAVAFPHYIDVSGLTLNEAVAQFGRMLTKLIGPGG